MQSMEMDDEEKLDFASPIPLPEKPEYPYGLRICLTEKEFEKLGLDHKDAEIGGTFHLHAMAKITSVSVNDTEHGQCCRVEAQITDLAIESEDAENEED
jgi:hypothetical protein